MLTTTHHGWDEEPVDLPDGSSFESWVNLVLLFSNHVDGFIFARRLPKEVHLSARLAVRRR